MITDKFIHIHIPRTGGTSTRNLLFKFCKDNKDQIEVYDRRFHLTLERSLEVYGKRGLGDVPSSFCLVRNPWDWYVSAFSFLDREGRRGAGSKDDANRKFLAFQEFIGMISDRYEGIDSHKRYMWRYWLKRFNTYGECLSALTKGGVDHIGRFENITSDLVDIFNEMKLPKIAKKIESDLHNRKAHKTGHDDYRKFYNEESMEIIADIEKKIIKEFKYEF